MSDMTITQIVLETVKIIASISSPILVAVIGFRLNKTLQGMAAVQWANQKAVEKKLAVFDQMAPALNDLYCYLMFVGNWKELRPQDVIATKRKLDKNMHIHRVLFSPELMTAYNDFIDYCFETYTGLTHDARIRTLIESNDGDRRKSFADWNPEWDKLFSASPSQREDVKRTYHMVMEIFSGELGLRLHQSRAR